MALLICLENHILVRGMSGHFVLKVLNEPCPPICHHLSNWRFCSWAPQYSSPISTICHSSFSFSRPDMTFAVDGVKNQLIYLSQLRYLPLSTSLLFTDFPSSPHCLAFLSIPGCVSGRIFQADGKGQTMTKWAEFWSVTLFCLSPYFLFGEWLWQRVLLLFCHYNRQSEP